MPSLAPPMSAGTSSDHGGGDASDTLSALERKLRDLERELASVGADGGPRAAAPAMPPAPMAAPAPVAPPPAAAVAPPPPVAAPHAPSARQPPAPDAGELVGAAREQLGGLSSQIDELLSFRDALQRSARELDEEYARVLARIGAPAQAAHTGPPPAPAAPAAPPLRAPLATMPAGAVAMPPAPAPASSPTELTASPQPAPPAGDLHESTPFEGAVVVDAGPFTDISGLSAFEQSLARVPGVQDVYVSGFEGTRALVEMRLGQPLALVAEMRPVVPQPFTVAEAGQGRLRIDLASAGG